MTSRPHPYMANSNDAAKRKMLATVDADDIEELFEQIPADHRPATPIELPESLAAESALRRQLREILANNDDCERNLNFLGAGVWQHHVPAICDEIWSRREFLTSVWGTAASDIGRTQSWFEYASLLGELVGMDFVGLPVYSWGAAVGHAMRMASRITERTVVLIPESVDPQRRAVATTYGGFAEQNDYVEIVEIAIDPETGTVDTASVRERLNDRVAAVYIENPSFLGVFESALPDIATAVHEAGGLLIVGVDPTSLGVVEPPSAYGADIVVGTTQPLGVHMNGGGGVGGFIATRDDPRFVRQYPTLQVSMVPTVATGERAFGMTLFEQSSYGSREHGNDWTGNSVYLWPIANAAYMSLLGPQGFVDLGHTIMALSHEAARRIGTLDSIEVRWGGFFKEFVVDFSATGRTVADINVDLRQRGIFGGFDLSDVVPWLGQSALYCVTEVHTTADIDRLVEALGEVTR